MRQVTNYHQLLRLRSADCLALRSLLTSEKRNKWTGHDMQSEMLECIAHELLRQISKDISSHGFSSIIVDKTTDVSTTEQVSMCIRHVSDNFDVHDDFVRMHSTDPMMLRR